MKPNALPELNTQNRTDESKWQRALSRVRSEIDTAVVYGATIGSLGSLFVLASLLNWCPRCGEWMGPGSEGRGPSAPNKDIPPPPARLLRAISEPLRAQPTPTRDLPRRENRLTPNSGRLESLSNRNGEPTKQRYLPPSTTHGRRVDAYYGGDPLPDSRPHAHLATFIRGDGEEVPIYERDKDQEVVYDSAVEVVFRRDDGSYEWTPSNTEG